MNELPTGTVTLLLADIEGSARLWVTQPDQMTSAVARLDRTLAGVVAANRGVRPAEPREKDSFVAAFACASHALACALALQSAESAPIRLRIGVHTGEAEMGDGGGYIGSTVDRTLRLRALARGGQTLLSGVTGELVADRLPAGAWLLDLGSHRLQGMPQPEGVVQLCHPDVRNTFPPLRVGEPAAGRRFPMQLTRFVGRAAELEDIRQLVDDHRLVTLTGAGGIGKTRLAVQLGSQLTDRFDGGVWYSDLAPITEPSLVAVRLARTLGVPDQPGRSTVDTLTRVIADRPMLMVLDNCEHLLETCAVLVAALLRECARLTIVVTSREPLGVDGELIWRTPSLSLADEATELFADRAALARPDFAITEDSVAAVAEICRQLDGVPLAIELAAARMRALSLTDIIDGLRDRFRMLTGGARTALPRQQTLRASVDWSHTLLSEPERILFRRLSVFLGGFDLDAARAVAGGGELHRHQVVDLLLLLVDKSLVVADDTEHATRYRLLETVRHYALEKLGEADEAGAVRTRHRDHYTVLFDTPVSSDQQRWADRADTEIDNLRAAFAWSREHGDIELAARLASALEPMWLTRGRILEGLSWFDAVLADSAAMGPATLARALADKLILDHSTGIFDRVDQADQALAIARALDDPNLLARVLTAYGITYIFSAEIATPHFAEAIEIVRALPDDWQLSWILFWQANTAYIAGDPAAARIAAEEGRDLADAIGDGVLARMCRWLLGQAHWLTGNLTTAAAQFRDVIATARSAHDPMWHIYGLFMLARTLAYQGDTTGAGNCAEDAIRAAADAPAIQQALTLGARANAALAAGDAVTALGACDTAWRACSQVILLAINALPSAQAALVGGDASAARRRADDAIAAAKGAHRITLLATRCRIAVYQGDFEQADRDAHDALEIAAGTSAYLTIPDVLECLAALVSDSDHPEAVRLLGAAQAIRDRTREVRFKVYDDEVAATIRTLRDSMGEASFKVSWDEGTALSSDEAIGYALRGRGRRRRPNRGWAALTPTERDVARLVGEGLGNKEIAARLFVSPRTVQTHLTHVYTKVDLTSRLQLAREAARRSTVS